MTDTPTKITKKELYDIEHIASCFSVSHLDKLCDMDQIGYASEEARSTIETMGRSE